MSQDVGIEKSLKYLNLHFDTMRRAPFTYKIPYGKGKVENEVIDITSKTTGVELVKGSFTVYFTGDSC